MARLLDESTPDIIAANCRDLEVYGTGDAVIIDRLKVDEKKIERMVSSVGKVIGAPDPVDRLISSHSRPDGLLIENRTVPFGTILIIFEARPDVCIEAAIIAVKAGNRILLKGGSEAFKYKSSTRGVMETCT